MDKFKNKDVYVVKYTNRNNDYLYFISKQHDPNSLKSVPNQVSKWNNSRVYSIIQDGQLRSELTDVEIPINNKRIPLDEFPTIMSLEPEPNMITLKHVTYTNRVPSILEHGLIPNKFDTFNYYGDTDNKKQHGVYLSDDLSFVRRMFEHEPLRIVYADKEDYQSGLTVLDVEVDANKLSKDMNATSIIAGQVKYPCSLYDDIISPENIKVAGTLSRALPDDEYWDEFDLCMEYYLRPFFFLILRMKSTMEQAQNHMSQIG